MGLLVLVDLRMKGMNERALHYISVKKNPNIQKNFGVRTWSSSREYSVGHTCTDGEAEVKCHVESQVSKTWSSCSPFSLSFLPWNTRIALIPCL